MNSLFLHLSSQILNELGGCDPPSDAATKHDHIDEASKGNKSRNRVPKHLVAASAHSSHKSCINLLGPFTAQAINFSLLSSEEIRAICSVALGLLVVLSRFIFHHTAAFKPLYVLLLTDFLIVAARLLPYAMTRKDEDDNDNNMEGAVKLLELGLVLHQMSSAIFIDCSFYLVVVILGLSLV